MLFETSKMSKTINLTNLAVVEELRETCFFITEDPPIDLLHV